MERMKHPLELASMRADMRDTFLYDTATLRRDTQKTTSPVGGTVSGWQTIGTLRCRVRPAKRQGEPIVASRLEAQADVEIIFEPGVDVRSGDRVRTSGVEYEVIGSDGPRTDALLLVVPCVRIKS